MRKARTNIRSFLPHRQGRASGPQRGSRPGTPAALLVVLPVLPSPSTHLAEARRPRARAGHALAASVVLHGIAVVALLHAASRRPASMDPESRIVVDLVEQPVLLPLAQSERSRPALGPVPQPRKQARKPRAVSPSSPAAAPSTPAPTPTPVRDSALPPASLAPSEPALASASVPAPAAKNQATNLARALPRPATQAGPTLAGPVATAEIEIRLRAATPGCYPYAAIRGNLEGVTKLGFCVGETGRAGQAQIVQSSGSQLLDSAALDCILPAASPFPPGRDVCVTVPIRFQLRP